ncbi:DUF2489 domain-containing protein [Paraglaciecola agarilytica]|uniref:DUF2489 domain-containing protein n=1 Tax=Paraglaciecola chathamensis TaxID=368405 RepID=UPI001C09B814|nr:DUF2489 domain-containing protein [Paraglaciecola agarilytica]MBU3017652.1 DUF2489 domain-containing protein [Paraglaciecola agarilytica]
MSSIAITLIAVALLIVASLAFYAGKLLFMLNKQNKKMAQTKKQRVERLLESIYTISLAMEQQQCNLSEGSIRLYHLHESLPIDDKPDFQGRYPGLYALYAKVSDLPTHEARDKLSTLERRNQDDMREAIESELESQILKDVAKLKAFTP